jgi:iron complex transport system ATP-binding protein
MVVATHDLNFAASLCRTLLFVREGRVLAHGPVERVLTRENIAALYGVSADIRYHDTANHLTVVPIGRVTPPSGRPA